MDTLKVVVFGPQRRVGALVADGVVDLQLADGRLPADLLGLIEAGKAGLDITAARAASQRAVMDRDEHAAARTRR